MHMRRIYALTILLATAAVLFAQQFPPPQPGFGQQPPQAGGPGVPGAEPQDQPGPPVARLGVINGDASVRRGDSGDWVAAALNIPLMAGDSLSVAPSASV